MRTDGIEMKGSLDLKMRSDERPSVGMSARMNMRREGNIGNRVHVDVNANVGLDVAPTGSMGLCFELGLLPFLSLLSSYHEQIEVLP